MNETKSNKEDNAIENIEYENLLSKRDFRASVSIAAIYILGFLSGTTYAAVFSSMVIFHVITLAMVMETKKIFALDKWYLLGPIIVVGYFTYKLSSVTSINDAIAATISDSIFLWFLMGVFPVFIHRGFNHSLGITHYDR